MNKLTKQRNALLLEYAVVAILLSALVGFAIGSSIAAFYTAGAFVLYFLPALSATDRPNHAQVFVLNLFLGWTFIGWVIAMVMAAKEIEKPKPVNAEKIKSSTSEELERMFQLFEKGAISKEDYDSYKAKVLS